MGNQKLTTTARRLTFIVKALLLAYRDLEMLVAKIDKHELCTQAQHGHPEALDYGVHQSIPQRAE
jgi:hypothetical protein